MSIFVLSIETLVSTLFNSLKDPNCPYRTLPGGETPSDHACLPTFLVTPQSMCATKY